MDNEVRQLAGEHYQRRQAEQPYRWGREQGFLVVDGQKVPIQRPRLRSDDGHEQSLGSYALFRRCEPGRTTPFAQAHARALDAGITRKPCGSLPPPMRHRKVSGASEHFATAHQPPGLARETDNALVGTFRAPSPISSNSASSTSTALSSSASTPVAGAGSGHRRVENGSGAAAGSEREHQAAVERGQVSSVIAGGFVKAGAGRGVVWTAAARRVISRRRCCMCRRRKACTKAVRARVMVSSSSLEADPALSNAQAPQRDWPFASEPYRARWTARSGAMLFSLGTPFG